MVSKRRVLVVEVAIVVLLPVAEADDCGPTTKADTVEDARDAKEIIMVGVVFMVDDVWCMEYGMDECG
jgi:hypothetical protein